MYQFSLYTSYYCSLTIVLVLFFGCATTTFIAYYYYQWETSIPSRYLLRVRVGFKYHNELQSKHLFDSTQYDDDDNNNNSNNDNGNRRLNSDDASSSSSVIGLGRQLEHKTKKNHDHIQQLILFDSSTSTSTSTSASSGIGNQVVQTVVSTSINTFSERSQRFPSVETRLKVYLSSWYLPPCSKDDPSAIRFTRPYRNVTNDVMNGTDKTISYRVVFSMDTPNEPWDISNEIAADVMFALDETKIQNSLSEAESTLVKSYNTDVIASIIPSMNRTGWNNTNVNNVDPPIILQYGDIQYSVAYQDRQNVNIPRIQKFRPSINRNDLELVIGIDTSDPKKSSRTTDHHHQQQCLHNRRMIITNSTTTTLLQETLPAIIWKLNTGRHYSHIPDVQKYDTIPFVEKMNQAVFRGAMTGGYNFDSTLSDEDNCHAHQRCNMVMQYAYTSIINARFTGFPKHQPEVINVTTPLYTRHWDCNNSMPCPNTNNNHNNDDDNTNTTTTTTVLSLRGERLTIEELVRFKAIIMLEGNDVSSGFKWALYSSSVVITTFPFVSTSWAMEELLEPWVHFVPIRADLSDLQIAVQWIIDNVEEAEKIGQRGKVWIEDLLFHPDSKSEEEYIQDEILKRYRANFFII